MSQSQATVGTLVRAARIEQRLSIAELATAAGVTRTCLYRIEAGGPRGPRMATVRLLAEVLGKSPAELFGADAA